MTDYQPPEAWQLADELDNTARARGWRPMTRTVSSDELVVVYRRDPIIALIDALPPEET